MSPLRLRPLDGTYAVCRLAPGADVGAAGGRLWSVTAAGDEVSVVCEEDRAPAGARADGGWACLQVDGPLPLTAIGVLASLTSALARSGLSAFALSTHDTDYLLVKQGRLPEAVGALRAAGHEVAGAPEDAAAPPQAAALAQAALWAVVLLAISPGEEARFREYERRALDIAREHGGDLVAAFAPEPGWGWDEVHVLRFPSAAAWAAFRADARVAQAAAERAEVIARSQVILSARPVAP